MISAAKNLSTPGRLIIPAITVFIACMVIFPAAVLEASKAGVYAWWNIVFPALLPFFISSELLLGYGVVHFMGVLLEPVMRPLFNLPGAGSFVIAVGYTSGFPVSASLAARLRKDRLCTRFEAERLMCFTNNASPLFMLVAVGVGMYNNPRLGALIAGCHYLGNLLLGLLLRFYKTNDPEYIHKTCIRENLFRRAVAEMQKAYRSNPRPFGKMLGDAVSSSINKLLVIGGFIVVFSVIIKVSALTGLMALITRAIGLAAVPLGFMNETVRSLSWGLFEITLGTKAAAEAAVPLIQKAISTSMILGWSGISVLAQVSAMISDTDLKMGLFIICRFLHSILAGILCFLFLRTDAILTWLASPVTAGALPPAHSFSWLASLLYFSRLCLFAVLAWALFALTGYFIRSFSFIRFRI